MRAVFLRFLVDRIVKLFASFVFRYWLSAHVLASPLHEVPAKRVVNTNSARWVITEEENFEKLFQLFRVNDESLQNKVSLMLAQLPPGILKFCLFLICPFYHLLRFFSLFLICPFYHLLPIFSLFLFSELQLRVWTSCFVKTSGVRSMASQTMCLHCYTTHKVSCCSEFHFCFSSFLFLVSTPFPSDFRLFFSLTLLFSFVPHLLVVDSYLFPVSTGQSDTLQQELSRYVALWRDGLFESGLTHMLRTLLALIERLPLVTKQYEKEIVSNMLQIHVESITRFAPISFLVFVFLSSPIQSLDFSIFDFSCVRLIRLAVFICTAKLSPSNSSALSQYGVTWDNFTGAPEDSAFAFDNSLGTTLVASLGKLFGTVIEGSVIVFSGSRVLCSLFFLLQFHCPTHFLSFDPTSCNFLIFLSFLPEFLVSFSLGGWLKLGYGSVARTWISSLVCYATRLLTIILTSDSTGMSRFLLNSLARDT